MLKDFKALQNKESVGSPIRIILNAVGIFLVSQLAATALVALGLVFLGRQGITDELSNSIFAQFIFLVIAEGLAVWLVISVLKKRKLSLVTIGLRKPKASDIGRGALGFLAFYALLIVVSIVLSIVFPNYNNTPQNIGFNNVVGAGALILTFISLVFLPPIGEEILVRGYLFSGLRSKMSFIQAGLITSALFALAHLQLGDGAAPVWGAAADTFVLSLVLVYLRESTGALYAGMMVHALNNLIAFIVKFH